ncbi:MAG TPA: glutamine--fructose-6-phosphate transaminase (isomerizing) [Solirubrobacteraceae bacterium]|nr:glutamine--fructose-6-phosphate transaminase (isomerizing) [Solirubrobacteraceae bacterium]
MCGIVGYVGGRPAQDLLIAGLQKLEYRGYDSAGVSVAAGDQIESVRAVGNLSNLVEALGQHEQNGGVAVATATATTGIGHTRWATHGRVNEANAHPHFDTTDRVHVVVNGIVENYVSLRSRLTDMGAVFTSETDAEVIAHLVAHHLAQGSLLAAVQKAFSELVGHYAFVALSADEPDVLVGARKECPLVIGRGDGESFLASAVPAFLADTRRIQYLHNDEIVEVRPGGTRIFDAEGVEVERAVETVDWDEETAEKAGYPTFMLKEIHEQADAMAETIFDRAAPGTHIELDDEGAFPDSVLANAERLTIVACGTSYHAGLIGSYALEEWARIPVSTAIASEYRYRRHILGPGDLVIGITQSGETADTLAAMRAARNAGATVLAVTNVMGSQATRDADGTLYTRAGLEVGVAATKTFITQVAVMYMLALKFAELRGTMRPETLERLVGELKRLPSSIEHVVAASTDPVTFEPVGPILEAAEALYDQEFFLYLGRHIGLAVALEGALKLKEISYIATDAYAAGEMKHGPIALLKEGTPVVCVATDSPVLEKMISNMQEVAARGAHVIAVASEDNMEMDRHAAQVIGVPGIDWMLQPLLAVIPLQLLAYAIAVKRGLNVDQPRNLAKTVTVE